MYDLGPISRAEIARRSGLTRTSVGELVAELESEGLAEDVGRGPSTGGKAPTLVALIDDARHAVTLDLGERAFAAALLNLRGAVRRRAVRDLQGANGDVALALVMNLIDEILSGEHSPILGIGVGTPGIVGEDGVIRWAENLFGRDLLLGEILQVRYGLPAIVANDSHAAAIATYLFGGEYRPSNLVAIKVGRGIGAGLVLNGELFRGDGDAAGEIGHTLFEADGAKCHCGRFGCLETVASAPAILRAAEAAGVTANAAGSATGPMTPAGREASGELTLNDVAAAAQAGNEAALSVVRAAGRALGTAIANLTGILDVREIVVHGSVTSLGEPWLDAIRDEVTRRSLGPLSQEMRVIDGGTGADLTLMGAAAMLLTRELGLTAHR